MARPDLFATLTDIMLTYPLGMEFFHNSQYGTVRVVGYGFDYDDDACLITETVDGTSQVHFCCRADDLGVVPTAAKVRVGV